MESIWLCCAGALLYQLIPYIETTKNPEVKPPLFDSAKIGAILVHLFASSILGYVYFHGHAAIPPIVPLHIGISTPIIIRMLSAKE